MWIDATQEDLDQIEGFCRATGMEHDEFILKAARLGVEAFWCKYYTDARIVALKTENGKEVEFNEFKIEIEGRFDESDS